LISLSSDKEIKNTVIPVLDALISVLKSEEKD